LHDPGGDPVFGAMAVCGGGPGDPPGVPGAKIVPYIMSTITMAPATKNTMMNTSRNISEGIIFFLQRFYSATLTRIS
jgi:hypothetical protein